MDKRNKEETGTSVPSINAGTQGGKERRRTWNKPAFEREPLKAALGVGSGSASTDSFGSAS